MMLPDELIGWNGNEGRELLSAEMKALVHDDDSSKSYLYEDDGGPLDEAVYCVDCGAIFVRAHGRDCPCCTVMKELHEVRESAGGER